MGQIDIHHPEFGFLYLFSEDEEKSERFSGRARAQKLSDVHIQRTIKASGPGRPGRFATMLHPMNSLKIRWHPRAISGVRKTIGKC